MQVGLGDTEDDRDQGTSPETEKAGCLFLSSVVVSGWQRSTPRDVLSVTEPWVPLLSWLFPLSLQICRIHILWEPGLHADYLSLTVLSPSLHHRTSWRMTPLSGKPTSGASRQMPTKSSRASPTTCLLGCLLASLSCCRSACCLLGTAGCMGWLCWSSYSRIPAPGMKHGGWSVDALGGLD